MGLVITWRMERRESWAERREEEVLEKVVLVDFMRDEKWPILLHTVSTRRTDVLFSSYRDNELDII